MNYRKRLQDLHLLNDTEIKLIDNIVDTFAEGKTIGSLLKMKTIDFVGLDEALEKVHKQGIPNIFNSEFMARGMTRLNELSKIAKVLTRKYDVMITNPPYIGPSSMEASVKEYAAKEYPNSKSDMFAMFVETMFVKPCGFMAMINMHSWMFLSSFEKLRDEILNSKEIINMAHLGAHAFETIGGEVVQTTTFVMRNKKIGGNAIYFRLVDSTDKEKDFLEANVR